jgi:hypothetical protein
MKKLKIWQKILAILVFIIILVLVLITPVLNHYLKKSILNTMNNSLNAEVYIEKVRLKLLKSEIEIYGIEINETNSENKENLIKIRKLSIELEDFNRKNGNLLIEKLDICTTQINIITDEEGVQLWSTIMKPRQEETTDTVKRDIFDEFGIFIKHIEIGNLNIHSIDRQKNKHFQINNIQISASSELSDSLINTRYSLFANYLPWQDDNETGLGISIEGDLQYLKEYKQIIADNEIMFNKILIENHLDISYGKNPEKSSKIAFSLDLDKYPKSPIQSYTGKIRTEFDISGIFDTISYTAINAEIDVEKLMIKMHDADNEGIFADFNLLINYNDSDEYLYSISTDRFLIYIDGDSIAGHSSLIFNDSDFIAENNISGEINLTKLNSILLNKYYIDDGIFEINSDLNGKTNKESYSLRGSHYFAIRNLTYLIDDSPILVAESFVFNIEKGDIIFNNNINYKDYKLSNYVYANNIQSFYSDDITLLEIVSYINKLKLPDSGKTKFSLPKQIESEKEYDVFPEKLNLRLSFRADSIFKGENIITKSRFSLTYSPFLIEIRDFYTEFADGIIDGEMEIRKLSNYNLSKTNIRAENLNIAYFKSQDNELQGIVDIFMLNEIYAYKEDQNTVNPSTGKNEFYIKDFSVKSNSASKFGYDTEFFGIDSLGMIVNASGDEYIIEPYTAQLNNIIFNNSGIVNPTKDSINIKFLFRIPSDDLDRKGRLVLMAMTERKLTPIKLDDTYINLLLEVHGKLSEPKYDLYELKYGR